MEPRHQNAYSFSPHGDSRALTHIRPHCETDDTMDVPTEVGLPAIGNSPKSPSRSKSKTPRRVERSQRIQRWRTEREMPTTQLVGVVRHTERADSCWNADSLAWESSPEFEQWPTDPPLSKNGVEAAQDIGRTVSDWAREAESMVHVVISSPYLRCIQTAAEIAQKLGDGTRLLIDESLGEVYGPSVMGENQPMHPSRPREQAQSYLKRLDIHCNWEVIGRRPPWGETLRAARWRFASRFLKHLQRSLKVRRNCILVSHGECVGATLSIMPSQVESGSWVEKVDFGGMFLAQRSVGGVFSPMASLSAAHIFATSQESSDYDTGTSSTSSRCGPPQHSFSIISTPRDSSRFSTTSAAPKLFGACRKPLTPRPEQWEDDELLTCRPRVDSEWDVADERVEDNAAIFAQGGDAPAYDPDKCAVGWQVWTRDVQIHQEKSSDKTVEKTMRSLEEKSSYTAEQLKMLLGKLSDQPLSFDRPSVLDEEGDDERVSFIKPVLSEKSTFLFGASNADLGLIGGLRGTASFHTEDKRSREGLGDSHENLKSPGRRPINSGTNDKEANFPKIGSKPTLLNPAVDWRNSKIAQRRNRLRDGGGTSSPSS